MSKTDTDSPAQSEISINQSEDENTRIEVRFMGETLFRLSLNSL